MATADSRWLYSVSIFCFLILSAMNAQDFLYHRLVHQQIAGTDFSSAQEMVSWLGAVQAQEYAQTLWAIGLRLPESTCASIEKDFNDGKIIRTHILRPTWHFVSPKDLRWMLTLSAPRVHAFNAYYYKKAELDEKLFRKCHEILIKELQNKNYQTRTDLNKVFEKKKIIADGLRLSCIFMHAELEGLICSGPRTGKQFTYALVDERIPKTKKISKEEALHTLTNRYFSSRGPATLQDYMWWSGLSAKEAKEGIASLASDFVKEKIKNQEYIFRPLPGKSKKVWGTFLMPQYDEYGIAYKNREAIFYTDKVSGPKQPDNPVFNKLFVIDGIIEGTWNVAVKNKKMEVETSAFGTLNKPKEQALAKAIKRYLKFHE